MSRASTTLVLLALGVCACARTSAGPATVDPRAVTPQAAPGFDSARAWAHLQQMVAVGPREAGSPALARTRAYITKEITSYGLKVETQTWTASTPAGPIEMVNLIVRLPGRRTDRLLITGHYDTKRSKDFRFVGASDGASSGAMLIELARVLKDQPRELTYELVWLDGEEAVCWGWYDCEKPGAPDNTYGSRYYVAAAQKDGSIKTMKAMVLLDMVGDRDLRILRDKNSAPWLNDIVWAAARRVGHAGTFVEMGTDVQDDHIPFVKAGVPSIDIIDLDYPAWHTAADTIDAVSARSLQIVGEVVVAAVPDIEKRIVAGREN